MTRGKVLLCVGVALFAALWPAAADEKKKPDPFQVKGLDVRVSGPYAHGNLAVFLLHGKDQDTHDYLTLDQGLTAKTVEVSEKKQERVSELQIENKSDRFLFLQEGDRLQGGKQDRIIVTSLVVPPAFFSSPSTPVGRTTSDLPLRNVQATASTTGATVTRSPS